MKRNRMPIRAACFFLGGWLMLCGLFSSCGKESKENQKETDEVVQTEMLLSSCALVYPSGANQTLKTAVTNLWREFSNRFGVTLELSDDFEAASADAPEILIGYTSRQESREAMEAIGYYDWTVRVVGSKLVVASHTEESLFAAVESLRTELLAEGKDERGNPAPILTAEKTHRSDTYEFFFDENPFSAYRIVYPDGNDLLKQKADRMAQLLKKRFSATIPVVSDAEPAQESEILFGVTNRTAYSAYYTGAEAPDRLHYVISAEGSRVLCVGTDSRTADSACERFIELFFGEVGYSYEWNLPDGFYLCDVAHATDADRTRDSGVDLRIMSYNILTSDFSAETAPFGDRCPYVASEILYYLPDVAGLQEVGENEYRLLEAAVGDTYAFTDKLTSTGAYSYTTLLYNKNTVRFVTGDNTPYVNAGSPRIRLMSWGLFTHIETGKRFLVVNTHWEVHENDKGYRVKQSQEMAAFVNELSAKYHCPVFTTGDFNTPETADYFQEYLTVSAQKEARYTAKRIANAKSDAVIDHINYTPNLSGAACLEALTFKLIRSGETVLGSDHDPIWADFRFSSP